MSRVFELTDEQELAISALGERGEVETPGCLNRVFVCPSDGLFPRLERKTGDFTEK